MNIFWERASIMKFRMISHDIHVREIHDFIFNSLILLPQQNHYGETLARYLS